MAEAAKPQRIAGYEILEKLGAGGMGVVFKARQLSLGRLVALKILSPRWVQDERFIQRFLKEAKATAQLSHPNIVRIYEVDRSKGGIYFYSMEYASGGSVGELLREKKRLEPGEALQVVWQVAQALEHAHGKGFVHRDIKPDNIMVSQDGMYKLADLGLAGSFYGPSADASASRSQAVVGTPYYMAPEQAEGKPLDARSDLYSLGATWYHLLTGSPPFTAENAIGVITKHLTAPRPDPRAVADVSEATGRLVRRLLSIRPDQRCASAAALVGELSALRHEEAEKEKPLAALAARHAAAAWPHARRAAFVLAALAVLGAAGLWGSRHWRDRQARRALEAANLLHEQALRKRGDPDSFLAAVEEARRAFEDAARRFEGTAAGREAAVRETEIRAVEDLIRRPREEERADIGRFGGVREAGERLRKTGELPAGGWLRLLRDLEFLARFAKACRSEDLRWRVQAELQESLDFLKAKLQDPPLQARILEAAAQGDRPVSPELLEAFRGRGFPAPLIRQFEREQEEAERRRDRARQRRRFAELWAQAEAFLAEGQTAQAQRLLAGFEPRDPDLAAWHRSALETLQGYAGSWRNLLEEARRGVGRETSEILPGLHLGIVWAVTGEGLRVGDRSPGEPVPWKRIPLDALAALWAKANPPAESGDPRAGLLLLFHVRGNSERAAGELEKLPAAPPASFAAWWARRVAVDRSPSKE